MFWKPRRWSSSSEAVMVVNDLIAAVALTLFVATVLVWAAILEHPEWLMASQ